MLHWFLFVSVSFGEVNCVPGPPYDESHSDGVGGTLVGEQLALYIISIKSMPCWRRPRTGLIREELGGGGGEGGVGRGGYGGREEGGGSMINDPRPCVESFCPYSLLVASLTV